MGTRLRDKVAIITGADGPVGAAIARRFAREGARIVVCGQAPQAVQELVESVARDGGTVVGLPADVSREDQARACVARAVEAFGRLDILVNSEDVRPAAAPTQACSVQAFEDVLRHNVLATFLMTRLALPHLQASGGNIVSAGSESGLIGDPDNTVHGGSKAWVHAFMRGVSVEQAACGVRANCVCQTLAQHATPDEIAEVYCFLASDEAGFVTGTLFLVDDGAAAPGSKEAAAAALVRTSQRPAA